MYRKTSFHFHLAQLTFHACSVKNNDDVRNTCDLQKNEKKMKKKEKKRKKEEKRFIDTK